MSDFGADSNPDENNFHMVARGYFICLDEKLQGDQFTISASRQVLKFCDGTNKTNLRVLIDPGEIAGI